MTSTQFRHPNIRERALFNRLLAPPFPGRSEVEAQLADCLVRPIDANGSLSIQTLSPVVASTVRYRVPTEGEAEDQDGVTIHLLLHVVSGVTNELEIYKENGSDVKQIPADTLIRVFAPN
jgi:hypothetical protein